MQRRGSQLTDALFLHHYGQFNLPVWTQFNEITELEVHSRDETTYFVPVTADNILLRFVSLIRKRIFTLTPMTNTLLVVFALYIIRLPSTS